MKANFHLAPKVAEKTTVLRYAGRRIVCQCRPRRQKCRMKALYQNYFDSGFFKRVVVSKEIVSTFLYGRKFDY
jgi:hypothetical protein